MSFECFVLEPLVQGVRQPLLHRSEKFSLKNPAVCSLSIFQKARVNFPKFVLLFIGARFGCLFPFNLRSVECPQLQSRTVFVKLIEIERVFDHLPIPVMEKVKCSFLIASEQRRDRNEVLFAAKENSKDPFASSSLLRSQTSHKKWSLLALMLSKMAIIRLSRPRL